MVVMVEVVVVVVIVVLVSVIASIGTVVLVAAAAVTVASVLLETEENNGKSQTWKAVIKKLEPSTGILTCMCRTSPSYFI